MQLVMAYYNNPGMLAVHMAEWARYRHEIEVIVVDDGSASPPDMSECPLPYRLFRILEDRPWNQNGARNLGMWHASGTVLLTDMDHLLTADALDKLVATHWPRGTAWRPGRVWPDGTDRGKRHPNSYVLDRADFWQAGGYNERWCGYYGTDATFRRQLAAHGVEVRDTNAFDLTLYEGHVDDAITHGLGRKGTEYHARMNPKLRRALMDTSRPKEWLQFPWEEITP